MIPSCRPISLIQPSFLEVCSYSSHRMTSFLDPLWSVPPARAAGVLSPRGPTSTQICSPPSSAAPGAQVTTASCFRPPAPGLLHAMPTPTLSRAPSSRHRARTPSRPDSALPWRSWARQCSRRPRHREHSLVPAPPSVPSSLLLSVTTTLDPRPHFLPHFCGSSQLVSSFQAVTLPAPTVHSLHTGSVIPFKNAVALVCVLLFRHPLSQSPLSASCLPSTVAGGGGPGLSVLSFLRGVHTPPPAPCPVFLLLPQLAALIQAQGL